MHESFREFIEAEMAAILDSMDETCRKDQELSRMIAMEWIEKNAREFREKWERRKTLQDA